MELAAIWISIKEFPFALAKFGFSLLKFGWKWWTFNRPAMRVLEGLASNRHEGFVFVKDLIVPENTIHNPKLFSVEGNSYQANPNIGKVWSDVEARGIAMLLNLLGRLGKKEKLKVEEMSTGYSKWDCNLIVLGAQAVKSREFYQVMGNVGFYVDDNNIYDFDTKEPIINEEQRDFGYGVIIKAKNNQLPNGKEGVGILLGGYGTLGTAAAVHYFCNNLQLLGKSFGKDYFSIVVRARIESGEQTVERLIKYDKVYRRNNS